MELGQVYIDNGDENMDINQMVSEDYPEEWKQLRDNLLSKAGQDVGSGHDWTYCESDVIFLRSCSEISYSELKTLSLNSQSEGLLECSWCDDLFLTNGQLTRHWLVTHLQWDTACHRCHHQLNNSLLRHECHFTCTDCNKTHKTKASLMRHSLKVHSKFYCVLCEETQNSLEEMRRHIEEETTMLENNCILCKYSFKDSTNRPKEHLLKNHFGPITINKPTVFEDKSSKSSDIELITHISMKYRPNKTETYQFDNYSCPHCQRKFSAQSGLKIHVGIAHKGGKVIFCSRCPSAFADVTLCKSHFKEEHGNKNHSLAKKRKQISQLVAEPHKSLVPSNLAVDGSDKNFNLCSKFINNNNQNNINEISNNNQQNTASIIQEPQPQESITPAPKLQCPAQQPRKKKPQRPLPDLLKIDSGEEGKLVIPAPLIPKTQQIDLKIKPIDSLTCSNDSGMMKKAMHEQPIAPKPVKTILPAPVVSTNYQVIMPTNQSTQQQVYVPAMTNTGTTILLKIEEAQRHLNSGIVTFLPSSSTTNSQVQTAPTEKIDSIQTSFSNNSTVREDTDKTIMRDKVALNLPVVMTKRTNKKLAQDNPFFKIKRAAVALEGECRSCQQVFSFLNTRSMVQHYQIQHGQTIQIIQFKLYYEIVSKHNKTSIKFFICAFCGKEFTTKYVF